MNRGELDQTQATEIVKPNLTPVPRELTRIRTRFKLMNYKGCLYFSGANPTYTLQELNRDKK